MMSWDPSFRSTVRVMEPLGDGSSKEVYLPLFVKLESLKKNQSDGAPRNVTCSLYDLAGRVARIQFSINEDRISIDDFFNETCLKKCGTRFIEEVVLVAEQFKEKCGKKLKIEVYAGCSSHSFYYLLGFKRFTGDNKYVYKNIKAINACFPSAEERRADPAWKRQEKFKELIFEAKRILCIEKGRASALVTPEEIEVISDEEFEASWFWDHKTAPRKVSLEELEIEKAIAKAAPTKAIPDTRLLYSIYMYLSSQGRERILSGAAPLGQGKNEWPGRPEENKKNRNYSDTPSCQGNCMIC